MQAIGWIYMHSDDRRAIQVEVEYSIEKPDRDSGCSGGIAVEGAKLLAYSVPAGKHKTQYEAVDADEREAPMWFMELFDKDLLDICERDRETQEPNPDQAWEERP